MKENKNIERLFQEKFKDFEVSPPDFVWENIQEKLHPKEKKRRVIPFWFKTAGIAASFVAIVSVVFFNTDTDFKNTNTKNNAVVNSDITKENNTSNQNDVETNSDNSTESATKENKSNVSFTNETGSSSNSLVNNDNSTNSNADSKTDSNLNKGAALNSNTNKSNTNFVSNRKKQTNTTTFKKSNASFNTSNSEIVSNNRNTINYKNKSKKGFQLNSEFNDFNISKKNASNSGLTDVNTFNKLNTSKNTTSNSGVIDKNAFDKLDASKNTTLNSGVVDKNAFDKFDSSKNNNLNSGLTDINTFDKFDASKNSLNSGLTDTNSLNTSKNTTSNSGLTDVNNSNSSNLTSKNNNAVNGVLVENSLENSNSNAIVGVEEIKTDTITSATAAIEENPMEKLLREKETKKVVDEKEKRSKWAVNSYVAPVFFNSFASGSPLSEEFASNEKTFNNSTSYGVGIAYNLNKRLAIKTGVSNLNLDYDTENIAFYSSFEDQSKIANTNIERNANGKYLVLKHEKDVSKNAIENQIVQSNQNFGNLNQRIQYVEVPLELSYAILNKKFGVAIKGGMSTLFLTENEVSIKAPDGNMQIGKASNLNDVHFSSNVGLGFSYNFMKNFQLNLEPTLKYQINTFNKNSEDFTPYVIGVNTGISYKF
ncbi:PorT family protein [Flavobacterium sp. F372]|uniref:PorT family protein n=1 Tax=Flavobacterium bernardetii TaxID=2813823 RepID=A0ABR7IYM1_9FLAO|nr:outer membrane beta-barrel protein [Flavobacterium bernardetii]MBC5834891.1 PorT family protein [Flavobacterium bernardetii]NHF70556.1 PorT family protein [Flavobacterium bernardetii]